MATMNTLTNLTSRIQVNDFDFTKTNGLWVNYTIDTIEKDLIETDEQNICELLKGIGAIEGYKLRDGLLCVYHDAGDFQNDNYTWTPYSEFNHNLSQKDAIEIAVNHERGLIGKQLRKEGNEMMDALMEM